MMPLNFHVAVLMMSLGLVRIDGTGQSGASPAIHVFGGQAASIDFVIKPTGVNLLEPLEIHADLYQKGNSILAPIQKDIMVAAPSLYEGCFQIGNAPFYIPLISWKWVAPEVKRETQFIARLRMKSGNGEWLTAGQIPVTAYPRDFVKAALAPLSKAGELSIVGESKRLRDFLNAQKITFDDAGNGLNALPPNGGQRVYLSELGSAELAAWLASSPHWKGNLVVFCPDVPLLPGVFVTNQGEFHLAKVTIPLLDSLLSDPRSQKTFLEILNVLNNP